MKPFQCLFSLLVALSFFLQAPSLRAVDDAQKIISETIISKELTQAAAVSLQTPLQEVIALMSVIAVNPDNDTTPLFELRLALRHSLAALTVYQGLLPLQDFRWIKQQLTQLRIATDDVRDDDVMDQIFIEEFSCCSGNYPFGNFKQERSNVQQPLLGLLEGLQKNDLFKNRVEQMLSQIAWSPINGEELSLHELAKKKLSTCLAETFVSLPTEETSFVELHRFRIRIKKLRYMFEILEDTLPLSNYAVIYPQLVSLQSTLGRIHDLFNVEQRIEKELNNATSDDAAFFQTLLLQCDALLQQAHQDFFNDFTPAVFQKLQDDIKTTIDSL